MEANFTARLASALALASWVVAAASCGGSSDDGSGGASSASSSSGAKSTNASTSSSGSSGGGSTSAATTSATTSSATTGTGGGGSCIGSSLLGALGKDRLLVGGSMEDATAAQAPFDVRYVYLSGGFFDGATPCDSCASSCSAFGTSCANSAGGCAWWGCWQYDQDPPGAYVRDFISTCEKASPPQIPMFTYYEILQASQVQEGAPEVTDAANDVKLMTRYFNDWRFLLQQIGSSVAFLHIEPDFWGYADRQGDPHMLAAAVASANPTDCGSIENSIAGLGQCLVAMVRTYAPNAFVGLQASAWAPDGDVSLNTDASLDVAGEAQKVATFLSACGEDQADFVIVETSDRDAGYYQSIGRNTWWDDTNATLPDFHQDFAWVKALSEALGKPAMWWQTPLGNMNQNDTTNHWKDNRVDYFFAHMNELAAAHGVGAVFGAGAGDQTTPESDGGNLVAKANAYVSAGGQSLCP